jgi:sodium-dependent dicarboxylate transporter 2/3/5
MTTPRRIGLLAGPALLALMLALPTPEGLDAPAWRTAAVGILMAVWWLTEAIPIPATALVPLVLFPLVGAGSIREAAAPFANPIIYLFLGGFLIALAMQRWGLHRRIALNILSRVGSRPHALIGGFMGATAFLSMWVSNSAVALLMLPIGLSVIQFSKAGQPEGAPAGPEAPFGVALMLGIAYAANVGGMATLVGTPPNALLAGYLSESHGLEVGFGQWMLLGLPLVIVALPLVYLILTRLAFRLRRLELSGAGDLIRQEVESLGPMRRPERLVTFVFVAAGTLWITRPLLARWLPGISDPGIAIACGLLLFILPAGKGRGRVLDWEWAERLPWGVLVLFGGGLSLAAAIDRTGLNTWLGHGAAAFADWPPFLFVLVVTLVVVLLTELTSNTATAAAFLPILGAAALEIGWDPRLLAVPAALAASCAFMLPIATPPNAIVYGSGQVTVPQMARAGVWLNAVMALLITVFAMVLMPLVFSDLTR